MTMKSNLVRLLQSRWVSPLVALEKAGCLSLSQRAGELRRDGANVLDRWLKLPNGKRVKEYRIVSPTRRTA